MKQILLLVASLLLASCQSDQPATRADAASLAGLSEAVSKLLGSKVTLGADAFLDTNEVLLEPAKQSSLAGDRPMTGRLTGAPERMQLFIRNKRCYLVHVNSGKLEYVQTRLCKPLSK